jgi:hypothetical protein
MRALSQWRETSRRLRMRKDNVGSLHLEVAAIKRMFEVTGETFSAISRPRVGRRFTSSGFSLVQC